MTMTTIRSLLWLTLVINMPQTTTSHRLENELLKQRLVPTANLTAMAALVPAPAKGTKAPRNASMPRPLAPAANVSANATANASAYAAKMARYPRLLPLRRLAIRILAAVDGDHAVRAPPANHRAPAYLAH